MGGAEMSKGFTDMFKNKQSLWSEVLKVNFMHTKNN
jgi:hypothetical protein